MRTKNAPKLQVEIVTQNGDIPYGRDIAVQLTAVVADRLANLDRVGVRARLEPSFNK